MDIQDSNLKAGFLGDNGSKEGFKEVEAGAQVPGPAGAEVDLDSVRKSSNLYPLDEDLNRDGVVGHEDEDLGINSDGTNPGTEYMPPLNEPGED